MEAPNLVGSVLPLALLYDEFTDTVCVGVDTYFFLLVYYALHLKNAEIVETQTLIKKRTSCIRLAACIPPFDEKEAKTDRVK